MTTASWQEFGARLLAHLPYLESGTKLILSEPGEPRFRRFVQFAQEDDDLCTLLVSNHFLDPERQADPHGEEIISQAGWTPLSPEGEIVFWSHHLRWPSSSSEYRKLIEMIVLSLRDGYGIEYPMGWTYEAWNDYDHNKFVDLSGLGLTRIE